MHFSLDFSREISYNNIPRGIFMLGFKEERRFPWAYKGPPLYCRAIIEAICYLGWWVMEAQDC